MLSDDEMNEHALVWGAGEPVKDSWCLRIWRKICMLLSNKKRLEN